ncbi:4-amino-4-deoxy-L-arabinose transferase [Filimonas lacunae]|uniref:4-amino-4-deoxy-L-arabinose transferase n=1 Tax=Filimonas lacunae TaxID=477680 RepID=A0A173MJR8_9BACT|nr:hypothetical protein [Filimonas lacunae]BAV07882.1 hypothetical protein FLA_3913 [Filimonas lacunae]SIT05966.1 4-amino-4-deoxy-L-arabinose transferase [Filimonas lacunae]
MKKIDLDSFIAAIIGFFVVYLFTHHSSIGVSPDSVVYTSVARNIYYHHVLEAYNHMPLVDFPVFYPIFLSFTMFLSHLDPVVSGGVINGILFGLLIYMCGHIMKQIMRSRMVKWALFCGLLISPALLDIYTMLWSETLFIVLTFVFFLLTAWYFKRPALFPLLCMAICAGLSCITRYAGVTLIGTGCLLIFFHPVYRMKKKLPHSIIFGLVSTSFLIANLVRNALITGTLTGNREKSLTSFWANMHLYGEVLCYWLPFLKGHETPATFLAFASLVLTIFVLVWRIRTNYNHDSYQNIAMVFGTVYILFIVLSASISRYEPINNRLLSPAYAPWLLVVVYLTGRLSFKLMFVRKTFTIVLLSSLFLIFICSQAMESYAMYREYNNWGIPGYTDDGWKTSPIVQYLQQHRNSFTPGQPVYSNAHEAAYFNTGIASESLPHVVDKEDVETFDSTGAHYLIWFENVNDTDLVSQEYIKARKQMQPVFTTADGAVYWCTNKK